MEFVVVGNPLNVVRRVAMWFVSVQRNSLFHEVEIKLTDFFKKYKKVKVKVNLDRLCGLMVRFSGYRCRGPGFDSWRYQIF
jgi:hypothetical protein